MCVVIVLIFEFFDDIIEMWKFVLMCLLKGCGGSFWFGE